MPNKITTADGDNSEQGTDLSILADLPNVPEKQQLLFWVLGIVCKPDPACSQQELWKQFYLLFVGILTLISN